jgi:hypothetical protein
MLSDELAQRRESGYDVEGLEELINGALADHPEEELWRLLKLLEDTPRRPQWPYDEPSGLEKVRESLPKSPRLPQSLARRTCATGYERLGSGAAQDAIWANRSKAGPGKISGATSS